MKTLVFGEILWDCFENKKELGGAPLNFACHFSLLGGDACMVSAVGNDENGILSLHDAEKHGVNIKYVPKTSYNTGYCNVTLKNGKPSYDLVSPVAYDFIPFPETTESFAGFYFGTLAQRNAVSRNTLKKLLENNYDEVFFDINIRQNYYTREIIDYSLSKSTILKTSREEIHVFKELGFAKGENEEAICVSLAESYNLKLIIVTLDRDGAMVYDCKTGNAISSKKPTGKVVSTVGAGDSFSACFFYNYLKGEKTAACLDRAVTLSDYVVTVLGAVCEYPYPDELKRKLGI
ncbi:MAG: PfkB family carbohydrate kinase [Eubacteriales bacterium]|nr:PfkB family carbohydrate kinase [Eubacteriales bacterium]